MPARLILPARRARVTPQREQREPTHEPPPWRVALAGNRVTTGSALIVTRQTADLVPFQFDFAVLTDWEIILVPHRLKVNHLRLCHGRHGLLMAIAV
jgi:hypothetical protein